ncbi:MAG: hypothetical protein IJ748_05965 [Bacteroidales bacterium]|nr:hypothetical protein [Bacteroidales bacterium]
MNGEVLDYKHINKRTKIPPKCSKTFTILAFGRSADYVYYKADYIPKSERAFMIDFELKSCNDNRVGIIQLIVLFALVLPVIFIFFGLIPYKMAKSRGRNPIHWIFLCFIITPLWVYIILAIIGDSEEKRRQYYEQLREYEEKRRQYYEQMTEDE